MEVSALLVCLSVCRGAGHATCIEQALAEETWRNPWETHQKGSGMIDVSGPILEFHVSRSGNRPGTNPISRPEESQCVTGGVSIVFLAYLHRQGAHVC